MKMHRQHEIPNDQVRWRLTDEHKARKAEWLAKWRAVELSTAPMTDEDRKITTGAVAQLYAQAKLDAPEVVFVSSPTEARGKTPKVGPIPYANGQVDNRPVWEWRNSFRNLRIRSKDAARRAVVRVGTIPDGNWVFRHLEQNLHRDDLARTLARADSNDLIGSLDGGQFDAMTCCHLSFIRDVVGYGSPGTEEQGMHLFRPHELLCLHSGIRFSTPKVVVVYDRPEVLSLETVVDRSSRRLGSFRRLHSEDGPSVRWRDGTDTWHLRGMEVPSQVVLEPEKQSIQAIIWETNEERRVVRIERFAGTTATPGQGWLRFLDEAQAECVDSRRNDVEGTREALMRMRGMTNMSNDGTTNHLVATCPTGRVVCLEVPRTIETCEAASRWLAGDRAGTRIIGRT